MSTQERLYPLLPVYFRQRDLEVGQPLRALMAVLQQQGEALHGNIAELYRDWFIATCSEWAVPYIGEAIGISGLEDSRSVSFSQRARVAHTIRDRRRKGRLSTLAWALHDASGWSVYARVAFPVVATTQSLQHLRLDRGRLVDVRDTEALVELEQPWSETARTVSITGRSQAESGAVIGGVGQSFAPYNLPDIAVSIWRLTSYQVRGATAARVVVPPRRGRGPSGQCFTFDALGFDVPLFLLPRTRTDQQLPPTPADLCRPMTRNDLRQALNEARAAVDGTDHEVGLSITLVGSRGQRQPVSPEKIVAANLDDWRPPPVSPPTTADRSPFVAVDPERGRLMVLGATVASVVVGYAYGFSGDVGGGPYSRASQWESAAEGTWVACVGRGQGYGGRVFSTLQAALAAWPSKEKSARITFIDSGTYEAPKPAEVFGITLGAGRSLHITTAAGERPTLVGTLSVTTAQSGALILEGLCIDGTVKATGRLALEVRHCTLVPRTEPAGRGVAPRPGVVLQDPFASLRLSYSISGPLLGTDETLMALERSIIDAGSADAWALSAGPHSGGAPMEVIANSCTVLGRTAAARLCATGCIFTGTLEVEQTAHGSIDDSWVPPGSTTPPLHRTQPAMALAGIRDPAVRRRVRLRTAPVFTSTQYGQPGYAQLGEASTMPIRTGGEDRRQMGVWSFLEQPYRETAVISTAETYQPNELISSLHYRS
ncbi:MAG: hypothetical protein AAF799_20720 [Myxococcota bacterium]